jgi:hypothetical protein
MFYRRTITDNSPAAWEANARGELTQAQVAVLRDYFSRTMIAEYIHVIASKAGAIFSKSEALTIVAIAAMVVIVIAFSLSLMQNTPSPVVGLTAGIAATVILVPISISWLRVEAQLTRINNRLRDDPASIIIHRVSGTPAFSFTEKEDRQGRVVSTQYHVEIDGHHFALDEETWRAHHRFNGTMVVNYFDDWVFPIVISLHTTHALLSEFEEALGAVVGIGDDGELVYEADLHDDLPDGEIIELGKREQDEQA